MKRSKSKPGPTSIQILRSDLNISPLWETEKQVILDAIKKTKGDKFVAAILLGISRTKIYRKLQGYGREAGCQARPRKRG